MSIADVDQIVADVCFEIAAEGQDDGMHIILYGYHPAIITDAIAKRLKIGQRQSC